MPRARVNICLPQIHGQLHTNTHTAARCAHGGDTFPLPFTSMHGARPAGSTAASAQAHVR
eukprot:3128553-Prymnesium_polylepis.1